MANKTFPADFLFDEGLISCSIAPFIPSGQSGVQSIFARYLSTNYLNASWQGDMQVNPIPSRNQGNHDNLQTIKDELLPFFAFCQIPGNTWDIDLECISPLGADRNPELFSVPDGASFVRSQNARAVSQAASPTSIAVIEPYAYLFQPSDNSLTKLNLETNKSADLATISGLTAGTAVQILAIDGKLMLYVGGAGSTADAGFYQVDLTDGSVADEATYKLKAGTYAWSDAAATSPLFAYDPVYRNLYWNLGRASGYVPSTGGQVDINTGATIQGVTGAVSAYVILPTERKMLVHTPGRLYQSEIGISGTTVNPTQVGTPADAYTAFAAYQGQLLGWKNGAGVVDVAYGNDRTVTAVDFAQSKVRIPYGGDRTVIPVGCFVQSEAEPQSLYQVQRAVAVAGGTDLYITPPPLGRSIPKNTKLSSPTHIRVRLRPGASAINVEKTLDFESAQTITIPWIQA